MTTRVAYRCSRGRSPASLRRSLSVSLGLLLSLLAPIAVDGQESGTVSGIVTDASTAAPLPSAQVILGGTGLGTLTTANGRFILLNVPVGSYQLQVQRIGFATQRQGITVTAGSTTSFDFAMESQ